MSICYKVVHIYIVHSLRRLMMYLYTIFTFLTFLLASSEIVYRLNSKEDAMFEETKRFIFKSRLHGTQMPVATLKEKKGLSYGLSMQQTTDLHDGLCGCNHPPTCQLWSAIEVEDADDQEYYTVLDDRTVRIRPQMTQQCSCCEKVYRGMGWDLLPFVGYMDGGNDGEFIEMRNCGCGSTISRRF